MKQNLESYWQSMSDAIVMEQPQELDATLLARLTGGGNSAGNYCSVSAECNSDGHSCGRGGKIKWEDIHDYLIFCSEFWANQYANS
jgi:hypothetical protein